MKLLNIIFFASLVLFWPAQTVHVQGTAAVMTRNNQTIAGVKTFSDKVGIGTTNPGVLFEVNGEARFGIRTSADCCSDPAQREGEQCYDTIKKDMFFSTGTVAHEYKQVVGTANCG